MYEKETNCQETENRITQDASISKVCEHKPSRSEYLRDYEIKIKFLSIGCVIEVGCKSIPFSTIKEGMIALNHYVENPHALTKIWQDRFSKEEKL